MRLACVVYEVLGCRPVMEQVAASMHVLLTHGPPPMGHMATLYEAQGPPLPGGVMATLADVGLVDVVIDDGELQMQEHVRKHVDAAGHC